MENQNLLNENDAKIIVENFIAESEPVRTKRKSDFLKYERFVIDGEQWDNIETPEGKDPCLTFNQSEDFINTYNAKLFPRNMEKGILSIGVHINNKDKSVKEKQEKEILDTYKKNKLPQIIIEQKQNFFVGGDACLYYPKDITTGKAKIISLDPTSVFLGWGNNGLNQFAFYDEICQAEAEQDKKRNFILQAIKKFLFNQNEASLKFKKLKRYTYWDKDYQIIKIEDEVKVFKNEDGFIPFSWIPNQPKAHRHEGISEIKKLYALDQEYNKIASKFSKRVEENTRPNLATFSDLKVNQARDEIKGVLPFEKGADAKYMQIPENAEVLNYLKNIRELMANKMAVNDAVQGQIKSNVSSLSMVYYFSPLMDRIGEKRVFWDEAFRELNNAILTYAFGKGEYDTDPIYESVLLTDQKTKIENVALMLENKVISHLDAIDELRGSENANEKLKEILAEQKEFQEIENPKPKPQEINYVAVD